MRYGPNIDREDYSSPMNRSLKRPRLVTVLAVLACVAGGDAFASPTDNALAYGIASFGGANQCGSAGQTHSAHTKSAAAFQAVFSFLGQFQIWGSASQVNNGAAGSNRFTDAARSAQCSCSSADASGLGIDSVPVAYIHTHGGHTTAGTGASTFLMGNQNAGNACLAGTANNFLFGNPSSAGKLEIAIVKACQGADFDVFMQGGYRAMVPVNSRFQVYNGFHGDSSCGGFVADYVGDYAANSFGEGVGENWIDEAYDYDFFGNDDCPTSIVYGNTKSARQTMFTHGGFIDRQLTNASKTGSSYFFVAGCSPSGGRKLPQ